MTWLLLDVSYLAHRAMYTTGSLSHKGESTGALYGLFRSVFALRNQFDTDYVCWCFDDRTDNLYRKRDYPPYKVTRSKTSIDPLWKKTKKELNRQINRLRQEILPQAKCPNIGFEKGYEADDVIAWYVWGIQQTMKDSTAIIVTADEDLFQLVTRNGISVSVYNPSKKKRTTENTFHREHGFSPKLWPAYKSLAGCSSDNIPGIRGIGPKAAGDFLRLGAYALPPKKRELIERGKEERTLFESLASLPYHNDGVPNGELVPEIKKDKNESSKEWQDVFRSLGFTSFLPQRH